MKTATLTTNDVLQGTFPVVPTPFHEDGSIDFTSFDKVIDYIINCGSDGLVFPGLASEYAQLTPQERIETTAIVGARCQGKLPFIVGAGAKTPEEAIQYSVAGAKAGAVCAMIMTPYSLADDLNAMVNFYKTLAAQAQIPIMLQNAPQPMGAGLSIDKVLDVLKQVPQIHYVKEETMPCGQRMEQLLAQKPAHVKGVFGGAGGRYILDELERGALGTVPACELTEMHIALVNAFREGDKATAFQAYTHMIPILNMQAVYRCSLTKEVLARKGIVAGNTVRVPGPELDAKNKEELEQLWSLVEPYMGKLAKP